MVRAWDVPVSPERRRQPIQFELAASAPEFLPPRNRIRAPALQPRSTSWHPAPVNAKTMPDLDVLRFRANRLLELLQSGQGGADVAQELADVLAEIEARALAVGLPA